MAELLAAIDGHREAILLGEIGALLHMFGKCSSGFLIANSIEGGAKDLHQDLTHLPQLAHHLHNGELCDAFAFILNGQPEKLAGDFTDFITKYKGSGPDSTLLQLFNTCHRMTSADEKGVVRKKQAKNDIQIVTPFGYCTHTIGLNGIDKQREVMDRQLAEAFKEYLSKKSAIEDLRRQVIAILKSGLSWALGETRQPANDVTLWAQSHGVASLYKPVLATLAMGLPPCPSTNGGLDYNNVRWRLFGIGWNGLGFVQRGRRPGDILKRQEILDTITEEIQRLLEATHPIGNRFYADLNGLFFTFPGVEDSEAETLVRELAPELTRVVRTQSNDELWPFFTLSKPRRTLTAITKEVAARDQLAALPKMATLLSVEQSREVRQEHPLIHGPVLTPPGRGQDVCPVCQFRSKPLVYEACYVCRERGAARQDIWHSKRQDATIWVDEVADENNRIALLTLRFDLSKWLSGQWLTTLLSQTFDDWLSSDRMSDVLNTNQQRTKLESVVSQVRANCEVAAAILNHVGTGQITQDAGFKATLLSTFFEDVKASQTKGNSNYIIPFLENLRGRINDELGYKLTADDLMVAVFTQNPSPARLERIWEETETFLDTWIEGVKAETFADRPQRLRFTTAFAVPGVQARQTYRIAVPGLTPGSLVVVPLDEYKRDFLTVDSLEKFHLHLEDGNLEGLEAVRVALVKGEITSWADEATGERLAGIKERTPVLAGSFDREPYLSFIRLAHSPVFCQLLLPANRTSAVLRQLLALADERFGMVQGKLPVHVSLLVANRRFPLYGILEAGQQALNHPSSQKGNLGQPWWNTTEHASDPFYSHYPTKDPNGSGYLLKNLALVDRSSQFWLTPGYFDFDFLRSTADRHLLTYAEDDGKPVRPSVTYGHLRPRPLPLHRLRTLIKVWDILIRPPCLGTTQRHHLHEALITKLEEWKTVGQEVETTFASFSKALLQRSFGNKWQTLSEEQQRLLQQSAADGLLLETLELFQHVLKERS